MGLLHICTTAHEQRWCKIEPLMKHHGKQLNSTRYKKPWNNYVGLNKATICTTHKIILAVINMWVSYIVDLFLRLRFASELYYLIEPPQYEKRWCCGFPELLCPVPSEARSACPLILYLFHNLHDRMPAQKWKWNSGWTFFQVLLTPEHPVVIWAMH